MRRLIVLAAAAAPLALLGAAPALAAPSATVEISGAGTSYVLALRNTGDVTIARLAFSPSTGATITGSGGPGEPGPAPAGGFGRVRLAIPPGQRADFTFTTAAPYPVGSGGVLQVAAARGEFVRVQATGPLPPPPDAVPPSLPPGTGDRQPEAPLPDADGDGDRVTNEHDLCAATPKGARLAERGCALTDVMVDPTGLLDARRESLADNRRQLSGLHAGAGLALLTRALRRLDVAAADLARDPCASRRAGRSAAALAGRGLATIRMQIGRKHAQVAERVDRARPSRRHGDVDRFMVRLYELESRADGAAETVADLRRMSRLLGLACRAASGDGSVSGTIESLDPAKRAITLSDGSTVLFGVAKDAESLIRGARVRASGVRIGSDVLVAQKITALDVKPLEPALLPCSTDWTVAPVQDFAAWQDVLYYDRRGYTNGGLYLLESGMAIGADFSSNCTDMHALHVHLKYTTKAGFQKNKTLGVISNSGVVLPAVLPSDVDPSKPATLTFKLWACWLNCDATNLVSTSTADAQILPKGSWGRAIYDRETFSVADGSAADFDTATLEAVNTPIPGSVIYGMGYGIKGGQSTYPQTEFIDQGEPFAVHDDVPDPMKPTGLLWAYIHGTRGGFPYHYWAKLPELVTDVVSFCPGKDEDSYYRLPWKSGTPASVTQGNFGSFSHDGTSAYALDLVMPAGTVGRAARGGRVDWVQEDKTKNYFAEKFLHPEVGPEDVPANALKIEHQDGTWSWYFHMVEGGVYPHEDDIVERGKKVVVVGNTGYSTGAHLHFQANHPAGGASMRSRYEVADIFDVGASIQCAIPGEGLWSSTNTPGT